MATRAAKAGKVPVVLPGTVERADENARLVAYDTQRMMEVLYELHEFFNKRVFLPRATPLPRPVITVSAEKRSTFGHFSPNRWYTANSQTKEALAAELEKGNKGVRIIRTLEDRPDELNVHSEAGLNRPFENIAATVYHEMCHQAQARYPAVYGKPGSGNYHNRKWHETCQLCGLVTEGSKGFTTVTDEFREFIKEFPRPERWVARIPGVRSKQPTRMRLWECECEPKPVKIRAAIDIDATCNVCGADFVEQVKEGGN